MSHRVRVLTAYRQLMKAQRTAFAGDNFMQRNARKEIRKHFLHPMPTEAAAGSAAATDELIKRADEAAEFLLKNIIQAKKKDNGKFVMNLQERHTVPDP